MKNGLYITADDLGLSQPVSDGIIYCGERNLIHGAALLVNCPGTHYALNALPKLKSIEVGLHLGLVEGYSLTKNKSLLDRKAYFQADRACLYLNWKRFAKDYLSLKISRQELREEFEAQIEYFKKNVGPIPFLNGTQHLHILPGIIEIVLELCEKHHIPKIRHSDVTLSEMKFTQKKLFGASMIKASSAYTGIRLKLSKIQSMGETYGITISGQTDKSFMDFVLAESRSKSIELVMHPGYDDENLRSLIPENYSQFDWVKELESLVYLKEKINES